MARRTRLTQRKALATDWRPGGGRKAPSTAAKARAGSVAETADGGGDGANNEACAARNAIGAVVLVPLASEVLFAGPDRLAGSDALAGAPAGALTIGVVMKSDAAALNVRDGAVTEAGGTGPRLDRAAERRYRDGRSAARG